SSAPASGMFLPPGSARPADALHPTRLSHTFHAPAALGRTGGEEFPLRWMKGMGAGTWPSQQAASHRAIHYSSHIGGASSDQTFGSGSVRARRSREEGE